MPELETITAGKSPTCPPSGGRLANHGPMWEVKCQVLRTDYHHVWRGLADDGQEARNRAKDDARRQWPGFTFCVRSVIQVEG